MTRCRISHTAAVTVAALLLAVALLALGAVRAHGQIVYTHNEAIWTMNDDGSGQHALVPAVGFPGAGVWTLGEPDALPDGSTVVFTATTSINQAPVGTGPAGACGLNCSGTYELRNGVLTRLSADPAPCGVTQQWCTSFDTEPRLTADGRVAYNSFITAWQYSCLYLPCSWQFVDSLNQIRTRALAADAPATTWTMSTANGDGLHITSDPWAAPDPANPALIAYAEDRYDASAGATVFDVHVADATATHDTTVVYDDAPFRSLAWTSDGTHLIDIEAGTQAGIWMYDPTASSPTKAFTWLLADPNQGGRNDYGGSFYTARAMEGDKVLFTYASDGRQADTDVYTIPLSTCEQRATPGVGSTSAVAGCTIQNATRLTTGGGNESAVSTASSTPLLAYGQTAAPTISGAGASGLAAGRPTIVWTLSAPNGAAKLTSFTLSLPSGLSFANVTTPARGIALTGAKLASAKLRHGTLIVALRSAVTSVRVRISASLLRVSAGLRRKIRSRAIRSLSATVTVAGTKLTLRVTRLS